METSEVLLVNFSGVVFAGVISWAAAIWVQRRQHKWAAEVEQSINRLHRMRELVLDLLRIVYQKVALDDDASKKNKLNIEGHILLAEIRALNKVISDEDLFETFTDYAGTMESLLKGEVTKQDLGFIVASSDMVEVIYNLIQQQHRT